MPMKSQTIAKSWEDNVARKLGDLLRRVMALERRSFARQRQIFMYFGQDGALPFTWTADRHSMVIESAQLDGAGTLAYTLNGNIVALPITVDFNDRVVIFALGVGSDGLGVTLTEEWPYP